MFIPGKLTMFIFAMKSFLRFHFNFIKFFYTWLKGDRLFEDLKKRKNSYIAKEKAKFKRDFFA